MIAARASETRTVSLLTEDAAADWERFVRCHAGATIYHTLAWKRVTEEGLGHGPLYLLARDGGGEVCGVLPLFLVTGIYGRRLVSVPMRDRGGVAVRDAAAASALVGRAISLARERRCRYVELRSLEGLPPAVLREHGMQSRREWITTRIDLSPGRERLWKALDRDAVRWAIRKAGKEGVRVVEDDTAAGMGLFHEMFVRTRTRMGIPPFPRALFDAIHRHLIVPGRARLFVARRGEEPVNAMICLLSGDTFIPAYAAPQRTARKCYPSEAMFWHTIEWAVEHGYAWYDFGADSPHQESLLWFKKKWGGEPSTMSYDYHVVGSGALPNFDSSSRSYGALRAMWRRLPPAASRVLGSWVTRQLS